MFIVEPYIEFAWDCPLIIPEIGCKFVYSRPVCIISQSYQCINVYTSVYDTDVSILMVRLSVNHLILQVWRIYNNKGLLFICFGVTTSLYYICVLLICCAIEYSDRVSLLSPLKLLLLIWHYWLTTVLDVHIKMMMSIMIPSNVISLLYQVLVFLYYLVFVHLYHCYDLFLFRSLTSCSTLEKLAARHDWMPHCRNGTFSRC